MAWSLLFLSGMVGLSFWIGWNFPFILLLLLTPFLVVALLVFTLIHRKPWMIAGCLVLIVACFAYPGLSDYFGLKKVQAARHYVELAIPLLERYRVEHGFYPASLHTFRELPFKPWVLDYGVDEDGCRYRFMYTDPQDTMSLDCFEYNSDNGRWKSHV